MWCCALSNDNELAVSGSRDHTIRMWRVADGTAVAAIDAGVDVFRVLISNNKKTVVALADKFGARKLIMLQVTDDQLMREMPSVIDFSLKISANCLLLLLSISVFLLFSFSVFTLF